MKAEWLEQEISLHVKVTTKTYETGYEMPCMSGIRGRRKRRNVRRWVVTVFVCGVCVCVCVWCVYFGFVGVCVVCVCVVCVCVCCVYMCWW